MKLIWNVRVLATVAILVVMCGIGIGGQSNYQINCASFPCTLTINGPAPTPVPPPTPPPIPPPLNLSTLPLLQSSNLIEGTPFKLPPDPTFSDKFFEYGGGAMSFDSSKNALIIAAHDAIPQRFAEMSIPASGGVSTFIQPLTDLSEGKDPLSFTPDSNGAYAGGTLPLPNGQMLVNYFAYYNGSAASTIQRPLDFSQSGQVVGPFTLSAIGPDFGSGYMGLVPKEWQADLGGVYMAGNCCLNIISRTSWGPALSIFNLNPYSSNTLLYYKDPTLANPQWQSLGPWAGQSNLFNGTTHIGGVVFPEGTRSILFFGSQGVGPWCYGGTTTDKSGICVDPEDSSKGNHAYPYVYQVWAYDANDLVAVKMGTKKPWELRPYATWNMTSWAKVKQTLIRGVGYDPATNRIYISQAFGDGDRPLIRVLTVTLTP